MDTPMHPADVYIVRIYRRDAENPLNIAGLVEIIGTEGKTAFKNRDDLVGILADTGRLTKKKKQKLPQGK